MTPEQAAQLNEVHAMLRDLVLEARFNRNELVRQGSAIELLTKRVEALEAERTSRP